MDNSKLTIAQQTNSNLTANILANSFAKNQLQLTANLLAPQANLDLNILQNTKQQASHIIDLLINHLTINSRSNTVSRASATDQSIANLTGQIVVHKSSANTEAHLQSKSLILSKQGAIKSCPELVIENDDVICTHGSSIGNLDPEALYYMQTRGMNLPQAKEILIQAFLNPILDKITCEPIKDYFNQ
jgi:Fe-S cluster assembly protein SufD